MEEEPESARPEGGKAQNGECHPPPSTEMEEVRGSAVPWGKDGKGCTGLERKEAPPQKDKRTRDTLQEPETTWCFSSQETLKGIRRLKRRRLMTK